MRKKHDPIVSDPKIMMGKPVVKGTRVAVELILGDLDAGEFMEQIPASRPRLTQEGISAACAFGAETLHGRFLYPMQNEGRIGRVMR